MSNEQLPIVYDPQSRTADDPPIRVVARRVDYESGVRDKRTRRVMRELGRLASDELDQMFLDVIAGPRIVADSVLVGEARRRMESDCYDQESVIDAAIENFITEQYDTGKPPVTRNPARRAKHRHSS